MKVSKLICVILCVTVLICSFPFYCMASSPAYTALGKQEPVFVYDSTFDGIAEFYKNATTDEILSNEECNYIYDDVLVDNALVKSHVYMRTFNVTDAPSYTTQTATQKSQAVYNDIKAAISDKYIKCIARSFSISVKRTTDKTTGELKTLTLCFFIAVGESNEQRAQAVTELVKPTCDAWRELGDTERLLALNDFILSGRFSYDTDQVNRSSVYEFVQGGVGVCEEFAGLTALFLDEMGYENYLVTGNVGESLHIWNMVRINGRLYHLDILHNTFVDENGKVGQITRTNLLVSTGTITQGRSVDRKYAYLTDEAIYDYVFENAPTEIKCELFEKKDGIFYRIPLFTTAEALISLTSLDGFLFINGKDGQPLDKDEYVGSGCEIALNVNGQIIESLILCVDGDIDGDGIATDADLGAVADMILQKNGEISSHDIFFGDINEDGAVTVTDYIIFDRLVQSVADMIN